MHAGIGYKSAHYTHHVTFGKDANIFSNYKQKLVKKAHEKRKNRLDINFNILIRLK